MRWDTLEVLRGKAGKWYWRIRSRNGQILCHSETCSSKSNCMRTVDAFMEAHFGFNLKVIG